MRCHALALLSTAALVACGPAAVVPATPPPAPVCPATAPPPPAPVASTPAPSANASPAASPEPPAPPAPPTLPAALVQSLEAAEKAIASGDGAQADAAIGRAEALAGKDAHLAYLVERMRATRFVYSGDFDRAAGALTTVIAALAKHPELPDEFWAHNAMMMIREAQGDAATALAENDQATLCAARGSWEPAERDTLAFQKDRWHRAYLTRMLAESRTGSAKQALVGYARAALDDYRPRGFPDSVAVLEAYFAALDGKREEAVSAAKRIDPTKDGDVEDLYLVVVGLEAGGDHAAAEAVRRVMRQPGPPRISRQIMLRWLDLDTKPLRGAAGFTPWHAASH